MTNKSILQLELIEKAQETLDQSKSWIFDGFSFDQSGNPIFWFEQIEKDYEDNTTIHLGKYSPVDINSLLKVIFCYKED